jgi:hypothetical protein
LLRHCKTKKHAIPSPETSRADNRALSSSTIEDAAATLANLQSISDHQNYNITSQTNLIPATFPSVAGNANNHTSEALQIDPNLEHTAQANTDTRVDQSHSPSTTREPDISQHSEHPIGDDFPAYPPVIGSLGIQMEPFTSWHIGEDFDFEAFNMSLLSPSVMDQMAWQGVPATSDDTSPAASNEEHQSMSALVMNEVQSLWITKTDNNYWWNGENASYSVCPTVPMTPTTELPSGATVNDRYRNNLSRRLHPRWREVSLPSTEFLV